MKCRPQDAGKPCVVVQVNVAQQVYDYVDQRIRRLDKDIKTFDSEIAKQRALLGLPVRPSNALHACASWQTLLASELAAQPAEIKAACCLKTRKPCPRLSQPCMWVTLVPQHALGNPIKRAGMSHSAC